MAKYGVTTFLQTLESDSVEFFELIPDLLVVLDRDGRVVRVNRSFERTLGCKRTEIYGQGLARVVLVDDLAMFIRAFKNPESQPFRLLRKDDGVVMCKLIKWQYRHGRSFVVMRRVDE